MPKQFFNIEEREEQAEQSVSAFLFALCETEFNKIHELIIPSCCMFLLLDVCVLCFAVSV